MDNLPRGRSLEYCLGLEPLGENLATPSESLARDFWLSLCSRALADRLTAGHPCGCCLRCSGARISVQGRRPRRYFVLGQVRSGVPFGALLSSFVPFPAIAMEHRKYWHLGYPLNPAESTSVRARHHLNTTSHRGRK